MKIVRDLTKKNIGDIVEITWADHFRYQGKRDGEIFVKTWGKVDEVEDGGIALVQSEVQKHLEHGAERIMDGQYIIEGTILEIKILQKHI